MARISTGSWTSTGAPYMYLDYDLQSIDGDTDRLNYTAYYYGSSGAYTNGAARAWSVKVNGSTVKSGSYNINRVSGTRTLGSGYVDIALGHSIKNTTVSISFNFDLTWSGSYAGTRTASGTTASRAKTSYTVSYNANGGSGAPSAQTKWYNESLTLSSTKPTRTGYTFAGWNTNSSGTGTNYSSGGTYTGNAAVTLYAKWTAITYTVSYNANGGTGAPGNQTKTYGQTLTLSTTVPTRTNYNFKGWATSASATTPNYQPGGSYTANAAITLYAVWEIAYIAPIITNISVDRCDSAGTVTDEGTYLKVSFNYQLDATYSGGMDYIQLAYKLSSATSYTNLSTYNPTEMSGSFTQVFGSGAIDTEYAYDVQIMVKDHKGNTTLTRSVGPMSYIIDFSPQGGIGIGVPAPNAKSFDIQIPFTNTNTVRQNLAMNEAVGGAFVSGRSDIGLPAISDLSRDALYLLPPGTYLVSNTAVNGPISGYYGNILVGYSAGNRLIAYLCYDNGDVWTVRGAAGAGGALSWAKLYHNQDHIHLENNRAIMGHSTSGSWTPMLYMNTSNQVELTWTSGGLRGRVMKQLWSGTWTSGSITVPEAPYYNMFAFALSQASTASSNVDGAAVIFRVPGDGSLVGGLASTSDTDIRLSTFFGTISGTTMTMRACAYTVFPTNNRITGRPVYKIFGIL